MHILIVKLNRVVVAASFVVGALNGETMHVVVVAEAQKEPGETEVTQQKQQKTANRSITRQCAIICRLFSSP